VAITEDNILSLDVGTSSVRAFLFDRRFSRHEDVGTQQKYSFTTTPDGGVEIAPELLLGLVTQALDSLQAQLQDSQHRVTAVAISTFWHCFLGVDEFGTPTTTIIHLFDTRSQAQVDTLTATFHPAWIHAITGCMPHTSYWPSKLLWLKETYPDAFSKTARWMSVGEYLFLKLFGEPAESVSMISASGIWDQRKDNYCDEVVQFLDLRRDHLPEVETLDQPKERLLPEFAQRWPALNNIPWYPAFGDGACNSIGSGCSTPRKFALMVGTSGAMRVVVKRPDVPIPAGIWCYRVNHERYILGGAVSNGGGVFRWATQTLALPSDAEQQIATRDPGCHGLTMLPYFAGERSPYWRPDLRAMIAGISLSTSAVDILQALLEGVSLRFKQIYRLLRAPFGEPQEVIASGGALSLSPVWLRMMTNALPHQISHCLEAEASSRGAAILVGEKIGLVADLESVPVKIGEIVEPDPQRVQAYDELLARDSRLYNALFGSASAPYGHG
jgi:gluconokinase